MHIYYATRGLRGRPYHSGMINTDLFAFFQGKRMRTIPSAETLRAVNAFPKCDIDMGEDANSEYVCEKGTFYIPKSICMGEVVNAGWAVDYYFVVLCGDAVELRYVRWDCPWYETVGRDTEVTDPAVIAKMERTLAKNTGQRRRGSVVRRRAHGDTAAARQLRSSATETWILGIGRGEKIPLTKKGFRFSSEAFDLSGCGGRI